VAHAGKPVREGGLPSPLRDAEDERPTDRGLCSFMLWLNLSNSRTRS
jgi:hypothetical protein